MYYSLRADKGKIEIKIKRNDKAFKYRFENGNITEKVEKWNDIYWLSTDRKALEELAKEIKQEWIDSAEKELEKIKNIKI